MDSSTRLQIPDQSSPGPSQPSRATGPSRPASAAVYNPSSTQSPQHAHGAHQSSARKRASHQVTTTSPNPPPEQSIYRDVYSHPAAVAYAAAHPRRTIPKFGPYLLLQTLGEGEFGKVKLGLHGQYGEEVAVKLIRRGNIDSAVRMSKVEREIEVLRTLKHPNIVRLFDVIETDKYIGIILEYASGGELFDHILAHRYLRERDACKLFSQLISGVWYIHQKKIVHRDLKLENLLLDRHRNVIITDFGFANRFEHRSDDLMQTSCGSPCYAAPELVISEGLYVGSAVDVWSCGVILYAMLAGYLPFDDDPANPDGDNISLLYKYIVNTPLSFPDYISGEARDLLSIMLVPDPKRRADLKTIMAHPWLQPYAHIFERTVDDLEKHAVEQYSLKRLAYKRKIQQQAEAAAAAAETAKMQRSVSARVEMPQNRDYPASSTSPNFLYETSVDESMYSPPSQPSSRRHPASAIVMPASARPQADDDFFAPVPQEIHSPSPISPSSQDDRSPQSDPRGSTRSRRGVESSSRSKAPTPVIAPVNMSPERKKTSDRQRHTLQVEYVSAGQESRTSPRKSRAGVERQEREIRDEELDDDAVIVSGPVKPEEPLPLSSEWPGVPKSPASAMGARSPSEPVHIYKKPSSPKPLPSPPSSFSKMSAAMAKKASQSSSHEFIQPTEPTILSPHSPHAINSSNNRGPIVSIHPASPPRNQNHVPPPISAIAASPKAKDNKKSSGSLGSGGSGSSKGHRKGLSVDKFVGKIWGSSAEGANTNGISPSARTPSDSSVAGLSPTSPGMAQSPSESLHAHSISSDKGSEKKSRRNTLTLMVEPFSNKLKQRSKSRNATVDSFKSDDNIQPPVTPNKITEKINEKKTPAPVPPSVPADIRLDSVKLGSGSDIPASTSKASKVMQWFRYRSKGKNSPEAMDEFENITHPEAAMAMAVPSSVSVSTLSKGKVNSGPMSSSDTVNQGPQLVVPTPKSTVSKRSSSRAPSVTRAAPSPVSDGSFPSSPIPLPTRVAQAISNVAAVPSVAIRGGYKSALHVHRGPLDQTTVTTGSPPDVMAKVAKVLHEMGLEVQQDSEYTYRCIRAKKGKSAGSAAPVAAFNIAGSAASNGVDKRGLPVPSPSFSAPGGMLRGLLMRRQSSQVSNNAGGHSETSLTQVPGPLYGDRSNDQGDEVRITVELTRIDGLEDTFSLDIRRIKGNLRSYKFIYDTIRNRVDFQR